MTLTWSFPSDVLGKAFKSDMEVLWTVMQHHNDIQELVPTSRWDIDSVYTPFIAPERLSVTARYGLHVHKRLQDVILPFPPSATCV